MLKQDRRSFERKRICLDLEARVRPAGSGESAKLRLSTCDLSLGGLSAAVPSPVRPGSRMAVHFPPHGRTPGCLANGRVVRCDPHPDGYRIGLEFDRYPSARGRMPFVLPLPGVRCA